MISLGLLALAPEDGKSVADEPEVPVDASPHLIQIATQIRALGLAGKRVILFAPIRSAPRADNLVPRIADALAAIDRATVLLVNLKTVPTGARIMASTSGATSKAQPASTKPDFSRTEWNDALLSERSDFDLRTEAGDRRVSRLDAGAGYSADLPTLIDRARPQVRYVLIDGPDVMGSASTLIAAAWVDAVVLMVQRGHAMQREIAATRNQFAILNVPIAGFVFLD